MATSTTNYNLSKPSYSDTADIAVINANMDKIDAAIKNVSDAASTNATNISALQQSVSSLTTPIGAGFTVNNTNVGTNSIYISRKLGRLIIMSGYVFPKSTGEVVVGSFSSNVYETHFIVQYDVGGRVTYGKTYLNGNVTINVLTESVAHRFEVVTLTHLG